MPVLKADDRIPKVVRPSDVTLLLAGREEDRPEDLRDTALVWLLYSSGIRPADACNPTVEATDLERGVPFIEDGKGDKDREAFIRRIISADSRNSSRSTPLGLEPPESEPMRGHALTSTAERVEPPR